MQKKKLLGTTLALAMVLPYGQAHAEILKNLKVTGSLDLQATAGQNVTDFSTHPGATANNDRLGSAQLLTIVNAGWDLLDDVHAMVSLAKNDRDWGTSGGNTHGNGQSQDLTNGAGTALGAIYVDQAYFKVDKVFGALDTTLGRQFYGDQGDMVVYYGPRVGILGMPVDAIDAARFDWSNDMLGATAIVGKITGSAVNTVNQADKDLRGLNVMLKGHENMGLGAYLYNQVTHATGGSGVSPAGLNDFLWIAGLKGKLSAGPAWLSGELAKDFGQNRTATTGATYTGWAFKADAGMKADLASFGSVGPWGEFDYGTGQGDATSSHNNQFTAINGDFRAGDIYTRFNSLAAESLASGGTLGTTLSNDKIGSGGSNTLANRVIWGVGVKLNPSMWQKLGANVAYWDYRMQTSPFTANGGNAVLAGNKHIGSEADLDLTWKHSENVSFDAGVGRFWAGGVIDIANAAIAGGQGTNPATAEWFDAHVKF